MATEAGVQSVTRGAVDAVADDVPDDVMVETTEAVVWVRITRPEALNALSTATIERLTAAIEAARHSDVIVLTGQGRAFCTGADLGSTVDAETVEAAGRLVSTIASVAPPVIAAVNGPAAGVGASIALACDLVLAAESAFFLLPFLPLGLVPDGGATHSVVAAVGRARAARMAFCGERISAVTAAEWGLIGEVVPDQQLSARVEAVIERICRAPRAGAAETKRLLRAAEAGPLAAALQAELEAQTRLLESPEYARAREGFLAKAPVDFRGRRG